MTKKSIILYWESKSLGHQGEFDWTPDEDDQDKVFYGNIITRYAYEILLHRLEQHARANDICILNLIVIAE